MQHFLQKALNFLLIQPVAALDGVFTGHLGHLTAHSVAGLFPPALLPLIQRFQKQLLRVAVFAEQGRNGVNGHAALVKCFRLKARLFQIGLNFLKQRHIPAGKLHQLGRQKPLRDLLAVVALHEAVVQNALVGGVLIQPQQPVAGLEDPIGIEHDAHQPGNGGGLFRGLHLRKAGLLRGLRDASGRGRGRLNRLRHGRFTDFGNSGPLFRIAPPCSGLGSRVPRPIPHGWSRGLKDRPGRCAVGRMERAAAPRLNGHSHWAKMRCILCGSFVFLF